jgi:hypothetical protein
MPLAELHKSAELYKTKPLPSRSAEPMEAPRQFSILIAGGSGVIQQRMVG